MALDSAQLCQSMVAEAAAVLGRDWSKACSWAEPQLLRIANAIVDIELERAAGKLTEDDARRLLRMQTRAFGSVRSTSSAIATVTVEKALNAALAVIREPVNKALGFGLV